MHHLPEKAIEGRSWNFTKEAKSRDETGRTGHPKEDRFSESCPRFSVGLCLAFPAARKSKGMPVRPRGSGEVIG
jgi:hypothetical protein